MDPAALTQRSVASLSAPSANNLVTSCNCPWIAASMSNLLASEGVEVDIEVDIEVDVEVDVEVAILNHFFIIFCPSFSTVFINYAVAPTKGAKILALF
jgi:hypothetical protein